VHSHEIQHSGALVDGVRRSRGPLTRPWVVTNWGYDILWFMRSPKHSENIRSVLGSCDYYGAECHRDIALARAYGFRGKMIGVWPVAGGVDVSQASHLRAPGPTSSRRSLSMKGLIGVTRQGDVALNAIAECADLLEGWELCGYQMDGGVDVSAGKLADKLNMKYTRLSRENASESSHEEVLAMHGRSRVNIALNQADGVSTSFIEAVIMGSFPVQSRGSCGYEITRPGKGALFVSPTDQEGVTSALRRALTDDDLVDQAALMNEKAARELFDRKRTRARVIDAYERIVVDSFTKAK
jgi:glycosyltransferase involved in cell wall biosynthesis